MTSTGLKFLNKLPPENANVHPYHIGFCILFKTLSYCSVFPRNTKPCIFMQGLPLSDLDRIQTLCLILRYSWDCDFRLPNGSQIAPIFNELI